jgi:hypothetical protein
MVIDEINCFQYGAIQIICDTLGGGGLAKVSPNIAWGDGEVSKNVTICICNFKS